ncbi:restriction endonuclease [Pseudomonas sp. P66]|uniref:Restriction endonuclease n=1 Tax=Pseudomonas arcuscaelestis TaxID=2710591 RepID=A0ABS2C0S3_9PSED|nr:restriction endonuclease [Pseudomonas arcuscaelestis]MBM5458841.1 restriction endonuclease [Pseudomonas arcuscaelestis]
MAKRNSDLNDLLNMASKLPWWISLAIALASGLYLHSLATVPEPQAASAPQLRVIALDSLVYITSLYGQFVVPGIFVVGAIASVFRKRKRRQLVESITTPAGSLLSISWQEFELLVGEALRRRGYSVQETGQQGPDGGFDLVARKDNEDYLVQCKHWRANRVGVPVVRELYGAMAAEGAVGGYVVTSGTFTREAQDFASGRNLKLVDGVGLKKWIDEAQKPSARAPKAEPSKRTEKPVLKPPNATGEPKNLAKASTPLGDVVANAPNCPFCSTTMMKRVARSGANAGGHFWGCASYPKCRGIRPIFPPMNVQ